MKFLSVALWFIPLFWISCESVLVGEDAVDSPENNFQILWEEFDRWHAGFIVRNINWDSLHTVYRPQVTPQTTREELWSITTSMMAVFNDIHTHIEDPAVNWVFNTRNRQENHNPFNLNVIKQNYITGVTRIAGDGKLVYGKLTNEIGYLHITDFDADILPAEIAQWTHDIDKVLATFAGLKGIVIDVRRNGGGEGFNDHRIAGAFADQKRLVFTVQTRNGPEHDDFDEPTNRYIEPMGRRQFTNPIVLITDQFSGSAAETFSLQMTSLSYVTHIGDSTAGGFSDLSLARYLPNGWVYRLSHQLYKTPDGKSPEGIGVVPDILIRNTEEDITAGIDKVLEFAIDILNNK